MSLKCILFAYSLQPHGATLNRNIQDALVPLVQELLQHLSQSKRVLFAQLCGFDFWVQQNRFVNYTEHLRVVRKAATTRYAAYIARKRGAFC